MSLFDDVRKFHEKFGLPWTGDGKTPVSLMKTGEFWYRYNFLKEELKEFEDAWNEGDLPKAADAIADLVWVALGTAHHMGIPFDAVWAEVVRANMAKVRASGADDPRSTRKNAFDVVKPADWVPPDVEGVLKKWTSGSSDTTT